MYVIQVELQEFWFESIRFAYRKLCFPGGIALLFGGKLANLSDFQVEIYDFRSKSE